MLGRILERLSGREAYGPLMVATNFLGTPEEGRRNGREVLVSVSRRRGQLVEVATARVHYNGSRWDIEPGEGVEPIVFPVEHPPISGEFAVRRIVPKTRLEAVAKATAHLCDHLVGRCDR